MSRRHLLTGLALLTVLLIPTFVSIAVGDWGRQESVQAARSGCLRTGLRNVALINVTRATAYANHLAATDPTLSARTRTARAVESHAGQIAAVVLDGQTDSSYWRTLTAAVDRSAVLNGVEGRRPFQCVTAYPPSELIP